MPLLDEDLIESTKPRDQDYFLWDSDIGGFGLKISPTGRKTFVLQLRPSGAKSPSRRRTIGRYGDIGLGQARLMAAEARDAILRQRARDGDDGAIANDVAETDVDGNGLGALGGFFGTRMTARNRIMAAATRIFVEQGFETSLEAIARAASVTRPTVYRYFGSKEELFRSVLKAITTDIPGLVIDRDRPPRAVLLDFAHGFRGAVLDPNYIALSRLAVTTSEYRVELSQHGWGNQRRTLMVLTRYLRWAMRTGLFRKAHAERTGERFLASVLGFSRTRRLIWGYPPEDEQYAEFYVREAVDAFVRDMTAVPLSD